MAMAEQQWGYNNGQWNSGNRSDHAVSQPIMMGNAGAPPDSGQTSPKNTTESYHIRKMVENVVSSTPLSVQATPVAEGGMRFSEKAAAEEKQRGQQLPQPLYSIPINNVGAPAPLQASPPDYSQFAMMQQQGGGYGFGSWGAVYPAPTQTTPIPAMPQGMPPTQQGTPTAAAAAAAASHRTRHDSMAMYGTSPPNYPIYGNQLTHAFANLGIGGGAPAPPTSMAGPPGTPNRNDPGYSFFMGGGGMMMGGPQGFPGTPPGNHTSLGSSPTYFAQPPMMSAFWPPTSGQGGYPGMRGSGGVGGGGPGAGMNAFIAPPSAYAGPTNTTHNHYGQQQNMTNRRQQQPARGGSAMGMAGDSVARSNLLEDFRANRVQKLTLMDLGPHVVEFAKDQHGSRFIQQKLETAAPREKQVIFEEVKAHSEQLMQDVFGNYVIQKFFEYGTEDQREQLTAQIRGKVMKLALQMYGCRVIQKALETIPQKQQFELLSEMEGKVLQCVMDQNGNHVIQKVIERVKPEKLNFITDALRGSETVCKLSTHPYGCRVIQRVLEHCTNEQKAPVLEELHRNLKLLVEDQYGNYVVQHVVEHGLDQDRDRIVDELSKDVLTYARHKYASNVIEKCLTHGAAKHRNQLISHVCEHSHEYDVCEMVNNVCQYSQNPPLLAMMKDQFANYVVQKMLDVADSNHRKKMMFAIRPHIPALRKYNYGKHIITKLEKYFQKQNKGGEFGGPPLSPIQFDYGPGMLGGLGNPPLGSPNPLL